MRVTSKGGDSCVKKRIEGWSLPKPKQGKATVSVPIQLSWG